MDLEEKYKEESGFDVGKIHDIGTTYYSNDYVEWLENIVSVSFSFRENKDACNCHKETDLKNGIIKICRKCTVQANNFIEEYTKG